MQIDVFVVWALWARLEILRNGPNTTTTSGAQRKHKDFSSDAPSNADSM